MENQGSAVRVNLYDLSNGMAKQLSTSLIGKQIEGIWHTGIVVFGKEYYWGSEIYADLPKRTPYGQPVKEIPFGTTEIPKEIFQEFLQSVSNKYKPETYNIFKNNCNNFTNECLEFLVGQTLPEYILGLPSEVLNTPIGRMIQPMIEGIQQNVRLQSHGETIRSGNVSNNDSEKAVKIII